MTDTKYIYFNGETPENREPLDPVVKTYLGGKGQSLAIMTRQGLPVPPFFNIICQTCKMFMEHGRKWPTGLQEQVDANMVKLVAKAERTFYSDAELARVFGADFAKMTQEQYDEKCKDSKVTAPLLVSVRSGSVQSMPGMMDTILNLGLNDNTIKVLIAKNPANKRFVYDSYRRFIMMFGDVVLHVDTHQFEALLNKIKEKAGVKLDTDLNADQLLEAAKQYKQLVLEKTGKPFPQDAKDQLKLAIDAVFESWNNERAIVYRNMNKISHDVGTAVNICTMVFGNFNNISGSGVGFTRDPKTGVKYDYLYGEFLKNAQGEDVVSGSRTPMDIKEMQNDTSDNGVWQRIYKELEQVYNKLENYYNDLVDCEFTIQDGKLYMLQARAGKRTAFAMVKIAMDMYESKRWTKEHMLLQIEPNKINEFLFPTFVPSALAQAKPIAKGLAASPGAAVGQIVFSSSEAQHLKKENGMKIVLCREETSPEDIIGMSASVGILTSCGGQTSHAAVVARQLGKTCVCGCQSIVIDEVAKTIKFPNGVIAKEFDWISIDGTTGNVYNQKIDQQDAEITPDLQKLLKIADETRTLMIRTNADTEKDCKTAIYYGAEGIGLTRSEHQFFQTEKIKAVRKMILAKTHEQRLKALVDVGEFQKNDFKAIFRTMDGRPVNIRLLDPPLHEFLPHTPELVAELSKETGMPVKEIQEQIDSLHEMNPMLGFRGCRLGVVYPEISEMQFRAVFEAAIEIKQETKKEPQVEIMIPVVISPNELTYFKHILEQTRDKVFAEKKDSVHYHMGTMVEIPRAALLSDQLASVCDYFSFGTNDLTQTTLGCSRDDCGKFMPSYLDKGILKADPFVTLDFEGVGKLIEMTVNQARAVKPNFKCGICGEQTDPASIEFLQKAGLTYISCSPYRVLVARIAAAIAAVKAGAVKK